MYNQRLDMINNEIANLERMKTQLPQAPIMQNFQFNPPGAMKYVNSVDDVNKEMVFIDTPFFSKDMSVLWLKSQNGTIKTYELTEMIEKDEKDIKIEMLEAKIRHMAKEDECMNYNGYNDYGRRPGFNSYGEEYGKRGRDMKYRGYDHLDRMYNDYGRYEYGRERYGHNEDTKRSLKYMLESMEDFARMLREDAQSQEEVDMIRQTAQRIAQM